MSCVGRNSVIVPANVIAQVNGQDVSVEDPRGELSVSVPALIIVELRDSEITVNRLDGHRKNRSLCGLPRSLTDNMAVGATEGYIIKMEIFGVGYYIVKEGEDLELSLGHLHPVLIKTPEGITFDVDSTIRLLIAGIDKQQVGQLAADIRCLRKDDSYKDKSTRYDGEQIHHRIGKTDK